MPAPNKKHILFFIASLLLMAYACFSLADRPFSSDLVMLEISADTVVPFEELNKLEKHPSLIEEIAFTQESHEVATNAAGTRSIDVPIEKVTANYLNAIYPLPIVKGRGFWQSDFNMYYALLSSAHATELYGTLDCIGKPISIGGHQYEILGVYRSTDNIFSVLSSSYMESIYIPFQKQDKPTMVHGKIKRAELSNIALTNLSQQLSGMRCAVISKENLSIRVKNLAFIVDVAFTLLIAQFGMLLRKKLIPLLRWHQDTIIRSFSNNYFLKAVGSCQSSIICLCIYYAIAVSYIGLLAYMFLRNITVNEKFMPSTLLFPDMKFAWRNFVNQSNNTQMIRHPFVLFCVWAKKAICVAGLLINVSTHLLIKKTQSRRG